MSSVGGSETKEMLMKLSPTPPVLRRKRRRTAHSTAQCAASCRRRRYVSLTCVYGAVPVCTEHSMRAGTM